MLTKHRPPLRLVEPLGPVVLGALLRLLLRRLQQVLRPGRSQLRRERLSIVFFSRFFLFMLKSSSFL